VFYNDNIDVAKKVIKACFDGGARILEFTNRGDRAIAIFSELKNGVRANLLIVYWGLELFSTPRQLFLT
jgi:2-dehydro-3-deoxyphosphogluconate aldolase/(4S)-4-hydroxy-2-oxoglutarate aldolase